MISRAHSYSRERGRFSFSRASDHKSKRCVRALSVLPSLISLLSKQRTRRYAVSVSFINVMDSAIFFVGINIPLNVVTTVASTLRITLENIVAQIAINIR